MNFTHDNKSNRNYTGITIVVLLHIIVFYGVVTGMGKRMVTHMAEVVETKLLEDAKPPVIKDEPPPPPPEMKAPPPPFIPPVEVNVQVQPVAPNVMANTSTAKPLSNELARPVAPVVAPTAPSKSVHVPAVADFNTCAKPEWPKASLRNEEAGTVTLQFLISADGRVGGSKIVKSSGFRELDKAAVTGISKCKFKPGMTDGKAEEAWMTMQYIWTLEN